MNVNTKYEATGPRIFHSSCSKGNAHDPVGQDNEFIKANTRGKVPNPLADSLEMSAKAHEKAEAALLDAASPASMVERFNSTLMYEDGNPYRVFDEIGTVSDLPANGEFKIRTNKEILADLREYLNRKNNSDRGAVIQMHGYNYTKGPLYIAGPMSGYAAHNFPLFNQVSEYLRGEGWYVLNPAENFKGDATQSYEDHYAADITLVAQSDAVAFLPNWEDSGGAVGEYVLADRLNKEIFEVRQWDDDDSGADGLELVPLKKTFVVFTPFKRNQPSEEIDDLERKTIIGQLVSDGNTRRSELLHLYGFDYKDQLKKKIEEDRSAVELLQEATVRQQLEEANEMSKDKQPEPLTEETVLQEADRLVAVDRQSQYGHPFDDFSRTAALWTATGFRFLDPHTNEARDIKPEDIAIAMMQLKISRIVNLPKRDSIVDAAGYAKTLDLVIKRRKELDAVQAILDAPKKSS